MSIIITPLVHIAINSAGNFAWYAVKSCWYISKRLIWGWQPTPEEQLLEKLDQQQKLIELLLSADMKK